MYLPLLPSVREGERAVVERGYLVAVFTSRISFLELSILKDARYESGERHFRIRDLTDTPIYLRKICNAFSRLSRVESEIAATPAVDAIPIIIMTIREADRVGMGRGSGRRR